MNLPRVCRKTSVSQYIWITRILHRHNGLHSQKALRPFTQCPITTRCVGIKADRRLQGFQGIRTRVPPRDRLSRHDIFRRASWGFFTTPSLTALPARFLMTGAEIIVPDESGFKVNVHVAHDLWMKEGKYDGTLHCDKKKRTIRDLSCRAEPLVRTFVQAIHAEPKRSLCTLARALSHETARGCLSQLMSLLSHSALFSSGRTRRN